jgi:SAM-dependent methyltransferase
MLSDGELMNLYTTKVKQSPEYFTQYYQLPACPIKSWNYSWQDFDFPRVHAVLDFRKWIQKHAIAPNALAYTCQTDPELEFITRASETYLPYPDYDLHTVSSHHTNEFDFFLFNQTLEHLQNPYEAMKSIYTTLKPGGYCFTSVPTINIPHSTPYHYGGYNPMGLAVMFRLAGFEVLEVGQWGNLDYLTTIFARQSWVGFKTLNRNGQVTNEENNVCQCWILGRKPSELCV